MSTFFDGVDLAGAMQIPSSSEASENDIGIDQVFAIRVVIIIPYPVSGACCPADGPGNKSPRQQVPGTDA